MNSNLIEMPFPVLQQEFFTRCLVTQRNVSPQSVACYRDAFLLLLRLAEQSVKKPPTDLHLSDLDGPFIPAFLNYLEEERHVSIRTRNSRLGPAQK